MQKISRSSKPALGLLKSSADDPYDQMRRNRLQEPRSRARSTSPQRHLLERPPEALNPRSEWFQVEGGYEPYEPYEDEDEKHPKSSPWQDPGKKPQDAEDWDDNVASDSRKSILECDVNPYLLVKKPSKDDNLSDDLSDNALEQENDYQPFSLFDPSKVKSIEKIPKRSSVAAIGGQRIRVFNEPREYSDDEDEIPCRIPIPKVSPKRPPRKLKVAKAALKSILKRERTAEGKRKNVLFNVDNVIFAPDKPSKNAGNFVGCFAKADDSQDQSGETFLSRVFCFLSISICRCGLSSALSETCFKMLGESFSSLCRHLTFVLRTESFILSYI